MEEVLGLIFPISMLAFHSCIFLTMSEPLLFFSFFLVFFLLLHFSTHRFLLTFKGDYLSNLVGCFKHSSISTPRALESITEPDCVRTRKAAWSGITKEDTVHPGQ